MSEVDDHKLKGIGGWLWLVAIIVVISPIKLTALIVSTYPPIFSGGAWGILTTPGTGFYIPFFGTFIIFELLTMVGFVLAWVYSIYLLFAKHYLFPKIFIALYAGTVAFTLLDALANYLLFPGKEFLDPDTVNALMPALVGACIWIPYMLVSKRVKITFVEHKPQPNR